MSGRAEPLRTCCEPRPGKRLVPVVTVITGIRDIPRLCICEYLPPDYSGRVRAWTRVLNPACLYCRRGAVPAAETTGVAA